jgi:lysylphosphatidylglycerol synthetase-like protein (DUF2156 family)
MSLPTIFTFLFALAALTTLACGVRKQWKDARLISAIVAILSFIMALFTASFGQAK